VNKSHEKSLATSENNFGEVIRATGQMAKTNPFRFSTKCQDNETDLLYYGYRYLDTSVGRWISRDRIEEKGGLNIQTFLQNSALLDTDRLGLCGGGGDGGGTCGPEVSYQTRSALLNAQMTFTRWPQNAKLHACVAIKDLITLKAFTAWEMEPLYTWGSANIIVAFQKKCYYASALNYSLWGTINRLCFDAAILYDWHDDTGAFLAPLWSYDQTMFWAKFWKHSLLKDYSDRADQAFAFTTYGYTGRLTHNGIPDWTWDGRYRNGPFDWFWDPNKPKPKY